jgi:hypothetical protein
MRVKFDIRPQLPIGGVSSALSQATKGSVSTSVKDGGEQIDYEDQDPRIHAMWLEATRKKTESSNVVFV